MENILIVDGDEKNCQLIKHFLEKNSFRCKEACNGRDALRLFKQNRYELIILERILPEISGEEICKYIRNKSDIPIIMVSAKVSEEDKIEGFKLGCDDYICKPFNMLELLYRIKAILKRAKKDNINSSIKFKGYFKLDTLSHELVINNKGTLLTNTEFKILLTLATNPEKIFTREELLANSMEEYYDKADRAIDSHIKNLRQKIELNGGNSKIIQTVYGVGYKLNVR